MNIRLSIASFALCFAGLNVSVVGHAQESMHQDDHLIHFEGTDPADYELPPIAMPDAQIFNIADSAPTALRVTFERLIGIDSSLKKKLEQAKLLLNGVFKSREFFTAVANHQYQRSKTFANNSGLSNEDIYDKIQMGKEKLSNQVDRLMNLQIKSYYENSSTVGYTFTNSQIIYVNLKFYRNYSAAAIARNLTHEWLHKVGFSHDAQQTGRRPYSVPYAIGQIVERLGRR